VKRVFFISAQKYLGAYMAVTKDEERAFAALNGAVNLANSLLDKSRELKASADGTGFPSLDEIMAMSHAGFQYVISQDGLSGQFKPKGQ
jgi:hypothetical protein